MSASRPVSPAIERVQSVGATSGSHRVNTTWRESIADRDVMTPSELRDLSGEWTEESKGGTVAFEVNDYGQHIYGGDETRRRVVDRVD
jgi:hypothetical protein